MTIITDIATLSTDHIGYIPCNIALRYYQKDYSSSPKILK